jgi:hypothetical protein
MQVVNSAEIGKKRPLDSTDSNEWKELMVRLNCSGITFGSQLDERHLFEWGMQIPGSLRWEQDTLVMKSSNLSQASLRDLLALFVRYQIPMQQLAQFRNARNEAWFASPKMDWHTQVFG